MPRVRNPQAISVQALVRFSHVDPLIPSMSADMANAKGTAIPT